MSLPECRLMMRNKEHFLNKLKERYPRMKEVDFTYSDMDVYSIEATPAGEVEAMYFHERCDFENAIISLAYKLERRPIPSSMGAMFLSGLVDRVAMKKTAVVILSRGGYSAITAETVGLDQLAWYDMSLTIRKNHELAHFVQRKLFPQNKNALRDEIKADMVGIIAAYGYYDTNLARLFLGTEGDRYRDGGRLQNYADEDSNIDDLMTTANEYIYSIAALIDNDKDAFENLITIESSEAGISTLNG